MNRIATALGAITLLASATGAHAQANVTTAPAADPLGEKLGQCMVMKSTGADRIAVARWLLGALASAPQVADLATIEPGKKEAGDRGMAAIFTRLITKDCATEARALFATGAGNGVGFQVAGEALGRVAMGELLTNPGAQQAISAYTRYLNPEDFRAVTPKGK